MSNASIVAPKDIHGNPKMAWIPRISRLWAQAAGPNWLMLPTSAGIVDPLHSTGIAHSLSGVLRAANILTCDVSRTKTCRDAFAILGRCGWKKCVGSIIWSPTATLPLPHSFEAFVAASSLYFISAIHCERGMAETGDMRDGFLMARSTKLQRVMHEATKQLDLLSTNSNSQEFCKWMRLQIQPWNDVGLLDLHSHNRLSRSIAPKSFIVVCVLRRF